MIESPATAELHPLVAEFFREVVSRDATLDQAAAEVGCARRTLDGWRLGAIPQPRHRQAIAAWLERGAE